MIPQPWKHGPYAKQDVWIAKQDSNFHEDVPNAPMKHGLYHVSFLLSIHVVDQF